MHELDNEEERPYEDSVSKNTRFLGSMQQRTLISDPLVPQIHSRQKHVAQFLSNVSASFPIGKFGLGIRRLQSLQWISYITRQRESTIINILISNEGRTW